MQRKDT